MSTYKKITVGDLIAKLQQFPADHELCILPDYYLGIKGTFQIKHVVEYYHAHGLALVIERITEWNTPKTDAVHYSADGSLT